MGGSQKSIDWGDPPSRTRSDRYLGNTLMKKGGEEEVGGAAEEKSDQHKKNVVIGRLFITARGV